ncbi:sesquipedalian-1-like [Mytilus trossulus]|uniref:sesquipedalian-1-like n=1 Tax=Mytilus trossulus TaxID=6551 RepID=UPI00300587FA
MRIDDGILTYIAASITVPITRQGFLWKKGENGNFLRRWFVLKRNMLFYFEKMNDKKPHGVIILEGVIAKRAADYSGLVFEISPSTGTEGRRYLLEASSESEMKSWITSLSHSSYEVMKRQYEFLKKEYEKRLKRKKNEKDEPCS